MAKTKKKTSRSKKPAASKALAKQDDDGAQDFAIMKYTPQQITDLLNANLGIEGFNQFDLDRIRIPSGSVAQWTLQSVEGEENQEEFEGVIIHHQDARRYWATAYGQGGEGTPPDCYSDDAIHGHGEPADKCGGLCERCPLSQFGSEVKPDGKKGRGQACGQVKQLFVVRTEELLPVVVVLPPTSLTQCRRYFLRLISRALHPYHVITTFALSKEKNADGVGYARAVMTVSNKLGVPAVKAFESMRDAMMTSLKTVRVQESDFVPPEDNDSDSA